MKKTLYISALALMLAGTSLTSCGDFLDAENKSGGKEAGEFFQNNPSSLLYSAYASLKQYNDQSEIYDHGTDLYIVTRGQKVDEFYQYSTLTADNTVVGKYYGACYSTINYANGVLQYAPDNADLCSQAKFLKAYAYYCLIQQFGGVPLMDTYVVSESSTPRASLEESYVYLIKLLEPLVTDLPNAVDHSSGKPSQQAAAALLAKVYLAYAWDCYTTVTNEEEGTYTVNSDCSKYTSKAKEYAQKALDLGGFNISSQTFEDKWSPKNRNNKEVIFAVKYQLSGVDNVAKYGNTQSDTYGGYYENWVLRCNSVNQQSVKSMYLWEEGDERYYGTYMTTFYKGANLNSGYFAYYKEDQESLSHHEIGLLFYPWYFSNSEVSSEVKAHSEQMTDKTKICLLQSPVIPFTSTGSAGDPIALSTYNNQVENGVRVKKFDDPDGNGYCYRDVVLLDLSEMYLVMAEASLLEGNTSDCYKNLNVLRNRAGLADITSASTKPAYLTKNVIPSVTSFNYTDLDVVLDERAREMYAQKTRYIDLRRTKQLLRYNAAFNEHLTDGLNSMKGIDGKYKWLRPIPSATISSNTAISEADQNPGYKTVSSQPSQKEDESKE